MANTTLIQWITSLNKLRTVSDTTDATKGTGPLPVALIGSGQQAAAASASVVQAKDVHTCTVNATIAPTSSSTALVAVAAAGIRSREILIRNIGTVTVYIGEGTTATTAMWPLGVGETLKSGTLLAVNGITAATTGSVAVLVEARS